MKPLIIIAGPTASGKTGLSIQLARQLNTEIVSADSMQVYRHMNIGSAKPTREEQQGIVHHLIDIVSPFEAFSVKQYTDLAKDAIAQIHAKNKIPIVVGGTGLFINSLINNVMFTETENDAGVRQELQRYAEEKGTDALHQILQDIDPESALKIHANDVKRTIRAIEIYRTTGLTMSEHIRRSRLIPSFYDLFYIGLTMDRAVLYDRINQRVDRMMSSGLEEEVRGLLEMGLDDSYQSMQGIGYKELIWYLQGKLTLQQAVETVKQESRRYAKRQLTWFRRDERIQWFDASRPDVTEEVTTQLSAFIQQ